MKRKSAELQAELLEALPPQVRAHGLLIQHVAPLVSLGKVDGEHYGSWRTSPEKAWSFPSLEFWKTPNVKGAFALDVDGPEGIEKWRAARKRYDQFGKGLPPENWIVLRRANGHFQPCYSLGENGIYFGPGARERPIWLAKKFTAWCHENGADPGYTGPLAHNPIRTRHATEADWETVWGRTKPYTIGELLATIPFGWRMPATEPSTYLAHDLENAEVGERWFALRKAIGSFLGKSRNRSVSLEETLEKARELNENIPEPLSPEEVRVVAAGIHREHQRKVERGEQEQAWKRICAARGRKGGGHNATTQAQRDILHAERARGATIAQAGIRAGVSTRTAQAIVGRPRGHGVEQRRAKVAELRAQGYALRAIADAVECSVGTVHGDLAAIDAGASIAVSVQKVQATVLGDTPPRATEARIVQKVQAVVPEDGPRFPSVAPRRLPGRKKQSKRATRKRRTRPPPRWTDKILPRPQDDFADESPYPVAPKDDDDEPLPF